MSERIEKLGQYQVVIVSYQFEKAQLAQMKEHVTRLKDPALSIATPAKDLPLGTSAKY